jgi:hypothetical protein
MTQLNSQLGIVALLIASHDIECYGEQWSICKSRTGGNHVVNKNIKGGKSFLKSAAAFVGIRNVVLRINDANKDLAKGNTSGAALELKQANRS